MDDKTAAKWNEMVNKFAMTALIKQRNLGYCSLPELWDEKNDLSYIAVTDGICAFVVCVKDFVVDLSRAIYMDELMGSMTLKPEDVRARLSSIHYTDYFDSRENALLYTDGNKHALPVDREYVSRLDKTGRSVQYHASSHENRILALDYDTCLPCALIMPTRLGAFSFDDFDSLSEAFVNMKAREK